MFENITFIFFHPSVFMFELGISLNRYVETDSRTNDKWVRKELSIGLLLLAIRVNWLYTYDQEEENKYFS